MVSQIRDPLDRLVTRREAHAIAVKVLEQMLSAMAKAQQGADEQDTWPVVACEDRDSPEWKSAYAEWKAAPDRLPTDRFFFPNVRATI